VSLYVDSSALIKRYIEEPDSDACDELLRSDPTLITGRHTVIEIRRNLARLLGERDLAEVKERFERDLAVIFLVELDATTSEAAAAIVEVIDVRTLDALHLAAARRVGGTALPILTYDVRQAQTARSLGFSVLGA
jgi:predicted nucleic acid-binding protein